MDIIDKQLDFLAVFNQSIGLINQVIKKAWFELLLMAIINTLNSFYLQKNYAQNSYVAMIVSMAIVFLSFLLIKTAIYFKINYFLHKQSLNSSQAWALALLKWPTVIGSAAILIFIAIVTAGLFFYLSNFAKFFVLGTLLTIIILTVYASIVLPLIVVENKKTIPAIQMSFSRVHSHWWWVASLLLTNTIFIIIINAVMNKLLGLNGILISTFFIEAWQSALILCIYYQLTFRQHARIT